VRLSAGDLARARGLVIEQIGSAECAWAGRSAKPPACDRRPMAGAPDLRTKAGLRLDQGLEARSTSSGSSNPAHPRSVADNLLLPARKASGAAFACSIGAKDGRSSSSGWLIAAVSGFESAAAAEWAEAFAALSPSRLATHFLAQPAPALTSAQRLVRWAAPRTGIASCCCWATRPHPGLSSDSRPGNQHAPCVRDSCGQLAGARSWREERSRPYLCGPGAFRRAGSGGFARAIAASGMRPGRRSLLRRSGWRDPIAWLSTWIGLELENAFPGWSAANRLRPGSRPRQLIRLKLGPIDGASVLSVDGQNPPSPLRPGCRLAQACRRSPAGPASGNQPPAPQPYPTKQRVAPGAKTGTFELCALRNQRPMQAVARALADPLGWITRCGRRSQDSVGNVLPKKSPRRPEKTASKPAR